MQIIRTLPANLLVILLHGDSKYNSFQDNWKISIDFKEVWIGPLEKLNAVAKACIVLPYYLYTCIYIYIYTFGTGGSLFCMETRSFVPHTASAREQTNVLPALLAQSLPKVSFQPYFPWSCNTAFHRKEMFMKCWYWALSNIQSGLVQALLFVSSKCIFTALILLIYHCWLQWRLPWFTFTGTQKASLLRQNSGMFSSCIY